MNNTYNILPIAESDRVEFKTTFNDEVVISLVAFSNTRGGAEILHIEDKTVVSFRVSEYPVKPVSIKGRYYKRMGNANHSLSVSDVVDMHLQSVNSSWDFYQIKNL